jgi:HYR domain/Domain of unknown function (DUF3416)
MHAGALRRSAVLAVIGALSITGIASADAIKADGDVIDPGPPLTTVPWGDVSPGAVITIPIGFELTCAGTSHPDAGQTISMAKSISSPAPGGDIISVTPGEIAPIPDWWPDDGTTCPTPTPKWSDGDFSIVTLRAPTAPNVGYTYTIAYAPSIAPVGADDVNAIKGSAPTITIRLNVVAGGPVNAAPVLTLPGDQTVEGNTTGGWVAAYSGVSATDAEDDPDPTPTCSPGPGTVLGLVTTTVSCSVTDSGGRTTSGSFHVTVVDTTAPSLAGVPRDMHLVTTDPSGTTVTYATPSATDVVDAAPTVVCDLASGAHVGLGPTTVTCTATDARGNHASAAFTVDVTYVAPAHVAAVTWFEPIGADTTTFSANRGRTIPVKADLWIDGARRTRGDAELRLVPCDGGATMHLPLAFSGDRWGAKLDTSMLTGDCYTVDAWIDGLDAGSFRLDLRGGESAAASRNKGTAAITGKDHPPKDHQNGGRR